MNEEQYNNSKGDCYRVDQSERERESLRSGLRIQLLRKVEMCEESNQDRLTVRKRLI